MPRVRPGYKTITCEVPADVLAAVVALSERHGRTLHAEIASALRRHLATPPVVVIVEGPTVETEKVERPEVLPKRAGRPKRGGSGAGKGK